MNRRNILSANLTCMSLVLAMMLIGWGKSDPVQSQTEWQGECSQVGYDPYPMIMHVNERKGNEISGLLHWPTLRNSKTRFRGAIEDKNVSFTEYELIEGSGIALPTLYRGEIIGETVSGTWLYAGQIGTFQIEKSKK